MWYNPEFETTASKPRSRRARHVRYGVTASRFRVDDILGNFLWFVLDLGKLNLTLQELLRVFIHSPHLLVHSGDVFFQGFHDFAQRVDFLKLFKMLGEPSKRC